MAASITFFPVDNGDMTLVRLGDPRETLILIDCKIRSAGDDPDEDCRDVARDLRSRLPMDANGRPFVHVFALSHPDADHCTGLQRHFWLGAVADYPDDDLSADEQRIIIHELWSSPMVFRRKSKHHVLCADAVAFNKEARRRVKVNREKQFVGVEVGDKILVLGEDQDGKTNDLGSILVTTDTTFNKIGGESNDYFSARLLAPRPPQDEDTEEVLSKNRSSVVLNLHLAQDFGKTDACHFLTGGDADVAIWERLWTRYQDDLEALSYDVLQTPHHCSWHSLSYDSWSTFGEDAELSELAFKALSQARKGAFIVASCKPINDDDSDPPCDRAKREYVNISNDVNGKFYCTGEYRSRRSPEPLELKVTRYGPVIAVAGAASAVIETPQRAGCK